MNRSTLGVLVSLCACATPGQRSAQPEPDAVVQLEGKSGSSLTGTAELRRTGTGVLLTLRVNNAAPGVHGVHLHEVGDCSAPDATSAGAHWNPTAAPHGHLGKPPAHLGDIGNLVVDAEGRGALEFVTELWTVGGGGLNDVLGKALVIHATADDLASQPSGNSGARIGCGVVSGDAPGAQPRASAPR